MIKLKNLITEDKYDYADEVQQLVYNTAKNKTLYGGWVIDQDSRSGTIEWYNKHEDLQVYATPFWDGNNNIPINVNNISQGEVIDVIEDAFKPIKFNPSGNIKRDAKRYFTIMARTLRSIQQMAQKIQK